MLRREPEATPYTKTKLLLRFTWNSKVFNCEIGAASYVHLYISTSLYMEIKVISQNYTLYQSASVG